ncbi:MAG: FAD-binding protein [Clostridiales bacterium]|nr:FAD-binding protein [Clostridiales bacterium]
MKNKVTIGKYALTVHHYNTVIIGSGAAGLAAAYELSKGDTSFCVVTEGIHMGTSRNTGSDKQTYYKLSVAGDTKDSVRQMSRDLFVGGCMNGDTALCQAALSARGFFNLVNIGVPFPSNEFGEYAGYKTDHDNTLRAVSAGPLTSKYMVEHLEKEVKKNDAEIVDRCLAVELLVKDGRINGLVTLNTDKLDDITEAFSIFKCKNIILATGGPAGLYRDSVYPHSQTGSSGFAFRAGALGANLTEWQYGIASVGFRWNLSGSFQQVLPRYYSTQSDGSDENEFLYDSMSDEDLLAMTFLKGYQWPFDARKAVNGSSRIDLAVFKEIRAGRRGYLDFAKNPLGKRFDFALLSDECKDYLEASEAMFGTPIERLLKMNPKAYDVYKSNGIDLKSAPIEICVAAQHCNGGLAVDADCQTNIDGLFAIGEAAATFGIYRPGGSALNATQVDALRATQKVCTRESQDSCEIDETKIAELIDLSERLLKDKNNTAVFRDRLQKRMSDNASFLRTADGIKTCINNCLEDIADFEEKSCVDSPARLPFALRNRDLLDTQLVYLSAMLDYIEKGGSGRGSFVVEENGSSRPFVDGDFADVIQHMELCGTGCVAKWMPVRPIPNPEIWFENLLRNDEYTEN